jgi:hypothetical protein
MPCHDWFHIGRGLPISTICGLACASRPPEAASSSTRPTANKNITDAQGTRDTGQDPGDYLTAISGGGRTTEVIESNRTQVQAWEKFTLVPLSLGWYAIQANDGHYLTAVDSGGRTTDTIHSNATQIQAWEESGSTALTRDRHSQEAETHLLDQVRRLTAATIHTSRTGTHQP